jgi:hypothetical protein
VLPPDRGSIFRGRLPRVKSAARHPGREAAGSPPVPGRLVGSGGRMRRSARRFACRKFARPNRTPVPWFPVHPSRDRGPAEGAITHPTEEARSSPPPFRPESNPSGRASQSLARGVTLGSIRSVNATETATYRNCKQKITRLVPVPPAPGSPTDWTASEGQPCLANGAWLQHQPESTSDESEDH